MKKSSIFLGMIAFAGVLSSCSTQKTAAESTQTSIEMTKDYAFQYYAQVPLTTDISHLTKNEKEILRLMFKTADIMDDLFWQQAYGAKIDLMDETKGEAKEYAKINYGPWDRLNNETPFINGIGAKPAGATFYPIDMTKEEFEQANIKDGKSPYSIIRRNREGKLYSIPYHENFKNQLSKAAEYLTKASELAEDAGLKKYLKLRAAALISDDFYASDLAWMDMKNANIDMVVGPIENYEDQLFGYKTSYSAYILVKDIEWSKKLAKFVQYLPELQKNLPVSANYKKEIPGTDSDLNAYDVVYYAGDCNAAGKTIAINLPNDEKVQLEKGTRRLQLKNAMKAKFDKILAPIATALIDESQQKNIKFDAFFSNVMFHEVAHGLGIKNTVNEKGSVRDALKEANSALEEGKADILGLYMVNQLLKKGELTGTQEDYFVTFLAGILRSVRFGASSAHGQANMIAFNYFAENGAFEKTTNGRYRVNVAKMEKAMNGLSELILTLQGNGDYDGVKKLYADKGIIHDDLQKDLDVLKTKNIPVDVVFEQGPKMLGL
ncbi:MULTISPECIES: dipeptidyl-peptidase 3 family protein [Empedobacter]|uniref:Zn-dependent hydrolase n=1 Tax=Empedobacter falsenii TaxID=343874 RepID=A0A3R8SV52_9FLAO|nr:MULTISPECIES: Zn-dependent hydrolase [Empedobacter]MBW1618873.1 Zn-dependent hydrolase [Empedobacter falsenii]MBY0068275.1 Zn-dependent hydrolase [Empedobacter falsenii]MDH0658112.1 Zn-dependent hydrolase [Empedobacter sp. GD03865]MDH0675485.1 Zn-dependent hydrolase [Empedobacter sp. GD03861]MDH1602605.1 Zn-dependent hydrolase [Empedobacter sp. GD03739]